MPKEEYYDKKWFSREHLAQDLKGKSVKGGISTVGAQLFSFALTIGSTMLLARMLTPEDYGLVAMVTAFTGFVLIFKEMGLSQAVVQRPSITHDEISKVFWLNIAIGIGLVVFLLLLSPFVAWFYEEPRATVITAIYSLSIAAESASAQHMSLLRRQMNLGKLATATIVASATSISVGLLMAYMGFGYWSLVAINIVFSWVGSGMLWYFCDWRPRLVMFDRSISEFWKFGLNISGFSLVNYFSRNMDNVIIGRVAGSAALGIYNRAYQLMMIPITKIRDPLNSVVIPAMSSLLNQPERLKSYYKQYLYLLSFFSMPVVVYMGVAAEPLILLLLGEQWTEAIPIFQLLVITAFIQPALSTIGMVMIAYGHTRRFFYWGVFNSSIVVLSFFIGINWGVTGLIIAYAIATYLSVIPALLYCFSGTSLNMRDFFISIAMPMLYSVIAGLLLQLIVAVVQEAMPQLFAVGVLAGAYGIAYLLLNLLWPESRKKLFALKSLLQAVRSKKQASKAGLEVP